MTKASLAHVKAHLSELVDQAEHRKKKILILRHGKPAAAIVPVEMVQKKKKKQKGMTEEEIDAFFNSLPDGDPNFSAVEDLIRGRR